MNTLRKNRNPALLRILVLALGGILLLLPLAACNSEDCVNCVAEPPVVPTGVYSVSGDGYIDVYWYGISYYPYDDDYNPNVVKYVIYSRYVEENDPFLPDREFFPVAEVAWDENYLGDGIYTFRDILTPEILAGGQRFEYAVSAVNAAGTESVLSYEFVVDSPVEMGMDPVRIYGANSAGDTYAIVSGFDFSDLYSQPVNPWAVDSTSDIRVYFEGGVPYVVAAEDVKIQDYGVFVDADGYLIFEGVGWAPTDYYSSTGIAELILGHIYVVQINGAETHYAKFAVTDMDSVSVSIVWAYQTIPDLPELKAPPERKPDPGNRQISL